jgi:membrane-bound metal-dependent hydrolase YbcI (DUF457 family)
MEQKGWLAAAAVGGCLPDIDSLLHLPHRGPTHTLGFAFAASALLAVAAAAAGKRREAVWMVPVFTLVVWLHPVMDLLSGGGPDVVLFAPLWNHPFRPVAGGLPLHDYTTDVAGLWSLLFSPSTITGMMMEAVIFGPLFAATLVPQRWLQIALGLAGAVVWITFAVLASPRR